MSEKSKKILNIKEFLQQNSGANQTICVFATPLKIEPSESNIETSLMEVKIW
jgi:hypothetical protein